MNGAAAAVDFLASFGAGASRREKLASTFQTLHARGLKLITRLWDGLGAIDGVRTFGPPPDAPRTPTIAFTVAGHAASDVARQLAGRGVFVSDGHFYAMTAIERLGQSQHGVVRAGCACYTTMEEVERLIDGVRAIAAGT
jgi:selenocysteine lyase/cysteine desulfurase